ncbi:hypothetical protein M2271_001599 [Streptomyces sp. LBL]|nr:hypothetical protein [Streptomyces sp. LBL]
MGVALATQNPGARRIGSAARARVGKVRTPFPRSSRRQRQEELLLDVLRQLTFLTEEIQNANLIQLHRITAEQVDRAMSDPALAEAMSTLQELSDRKRRQALFVNREYSAILLGHRIGAYGWGELIGHLRVLARNPVFAEYWATTREHRRSLPRTSLEARVGEAVDMIIDDLADDPDEWWVVGPPSEGPSA